MPRSTFLLVRHGEDLQSERAGLCAYLSSLRRSPAGGIDDLLGIWLDDEDVANLPRALTLPDATGTRRSVWLDEAMGINGVWMLCWLPTSVGPITRADLVTALRECFSHHGNAQLAQRFVPVFPLLADAAGIATEMQTLERVHPGSRRHALYQKSDGGLVTEPPH